MDSSKGNNAKGPNEEDLKKYFIRIVDSEPFPQNFSPDVKQEILDKINFGLKKLFNSPTEKHGDLIKEAEKNLKSLIQEMKKNSSEDALVMDDLKYAEKSICPCWPCQ
ncbi:TPA: hypothetical protein ACGAEL_001545 [Legionella pneumophila]|uniref:hypothetical protein n=1 Tax=Legionella pneumophila TaxID=446 RepID=UPI000778798F|nr:hypothetical protein [Legionella pneumophila]HCC3234927.1 hypothetical protein [Legionella pneumophila subsp. pneumophila]HAT8621982.1 hypothetical protein [Legionella pneumophila]HAU9853235.1 hypothetical protein [Legionella pneumophila]HAU9908232.1 hypothetical protein [Legionella pneumophila]HAV0029410.1 hypothetical protein [Legionella pneumophila]